MVRKVPQRHRACSKCATQFEPGHWMTSVLSLSSYEEYIRADFCSACWQNSEAETDVQGIWRVQVPIPCAADREGVVSEDKQMLDRLLHGEDDPVQMYILALYLYRRGLLTRVRHPKGPTLRALLFEVKATGECLEVVQPSAEQAAQATLSDWF